MIRHKLLCVMCSKHETTRSSQNRLIDVNAVNRGIIVCASLVCNNTLNVNENRMCIMQGDEIT